MKIKQKFKNTNYLPKNNPIFTFPATKQPIPITLINTPKSHN